MDRDEQLLEELDPAGQSDSPFLSNGIGPSATYGISSDPAKYLDLEKAKAAGIALAQAADRRRDCLPYLGFCFFFSDAVRPSGFLSIRLKIIGL